MSRDPLAPMDVLLAFAKQTMEGQRRIVLHLTHELAMQITAGIISPEGNTLEEEE